MTRKAIIVLASVAGGVATPFVLRALITTEYFLPPDVAAVYVASRCSYSQRAMQLILTEGPSIALLPTDLDSPSAWRACAHTKTLMVDRGFFWFGWAPTKLFCGRLASHGESWLGSRDPDLHTPSFAVAGTIVATGLSDESFRSIGSELRVDQPGGTWRLK